MIELGQHIEYILGAYAGVALVLAGLIGWAISDARAQDRRLADLEARGVRRRSETRSRA